MSDALTGRLHIGHTTIFLNRTIGKCVQPVSLSNSVQEKSNREASHAWKWNGRKLRSSETRRAALHQELNAGV